MNIASHCGNIESEYLKGSRTAAIIVCEKNMWINYYANSWFDCAVFALYECDNYCCLHTFIWMLWGVRELYWYLSAFSIIQPLLLRVSLLFLLNLMEGYRLRSLKDRKTSVLSQMQSLIRSVLAEMKVRDLKVSQQTGKYSCSYICHKISVSAQIPCLNICTFTSHYCAVWTWNTVSHTV